MKTAISIPDDVFALAEDFAKRQRITRSALFTAAVKEYVQHNRGQGVTQALNAVYGQNDSSLDPVLEQLQSSALPKENW